MESVEIQHKSWTLGSSNLVRAAAFNKSKTEVGYIECRYSVHVEKDDDDAGSMEIGYLFVHPQYRKAKVASALLDAITRRYGCEFDMVLHVYQSCTDVDIASPAAARKTEACCHAVVTRSMTKRRGMDAKQLIAFYKTRGFCISRVLTHLLVGKLTIMKRSRRSLIEVP